MHQNRNENNTGVKECNRYQIVRIFVGERTAEQVVADLIKVHMAGAG
ncbi:MAG: hypothetical protein IKN81_06175 [Oscillospiraceae bacterium]|nr:hypothetical protein [Oscillospiraceae bacterium]